VDARLARTELEFLPAFKAAHDASMTLSNVQGSFRGAGLVPFDPEAVISKLDLKLRTPTPVPSEDLPWESQTPSDTKELASQNQLIKQKITRHQSSSLSPILQAVDYFLKGAQTIAHQNVLLQAEVKSLRKANELATKRKQRSKKRIQKRGSLTVQEGIDLNNQTAIDTQISQEIRTGGLSGDLISKRKRRCGNCGTTGHYISTCPTRLIDIEE
jgi:hypothetical protein